MYLTFRLRAFFQQPPASSVRDIQSSAFQSSVILASLGTFTFVLISLHIISWGLVKHGEEFPTDDVRGPSCCIKLGDSVLWAIGMAAQQGHHITPYSISLRTIFYYTATASLISYIAYTASITSSLSTENVPIRTLSQLFRSRLPIYASDDSVLAYELLKRFEQSGRISKRVHYLPVNMGVRFTFTRLTGYIVYAHQFHNKEKLSIFRIMLPAT